MSTILFTLICVSHIHSTSSSRSKRAEPAPWHTLVQLNRIIEAGNTRALDIENYTKHAAIRQNQQNALLSSSASVLSPMAALAMANNRFSPPNIIPLVRGGNNRDLFEKYTARSRILDNSDLIADRQLLFGTDPPPALLLRDMPPPPLMPPPIPPPLIAQPVILQRMLQPRMRSRGIGVVETPLMFDEPSTRIFPRPSQIKSEAEQREKLPTTADDFRRKDFVQYVFI